jgi:hypothetical protein
VMLDFCSSRYALQGSLDRGNRLVPMARPLSASEPQDEHAAAREKVGTVDWSRSPSLAASTHASTSCGIGSWRLGAGMGLRMGGQTPTETVDAIQLRCGGLDPSNSKDADNDSHSVSRLRCRHVRGSRYPYRRRDSHKQHAKVRIVGGIGSRRVPVDDGERVAV